MGIKGSRQSFSMIGISGAPQEPGVFVLWDGDEIIYIGRTVGRLATIKSVLTDHCLGVCGQCTQRATHYAWEQASNPGSREMELLHEFDEQHGRPPRCQSAANKG